MARMIEIGIEADSIRRDSNPVEFGDPRHIKMNDDAQEDAIYGRNVCKANGVSIQDHLARIKAPDLATNSGRGLHAGEIPRASSNGDGLDQFPSVLIRDRRPTIQESQTPRRLGLYRRPKNETEPDSPASNSKPINSNLI